MAEQEVIYLYGKPLSKCTREELEVGIKAAYFELKQAHKSLKEFCELTDELGKSMKKIRLRTANDPGSS